MNRAPDFDRGSGLAPGRCSPLGATFDGAGVNFAVFSSNATAIDLCVFDSAGRELTARHSFTQRTGDVWHGYLAGAEPGLVYGLRAYGPRSPESGQRFEPDNVLLDPWAKEIVDPDGSGSALRARVTCDSYDWRGDCAPAHSPDDTVLYELHVRGFSYRNPRVPEEIRGSYAGLAHPESIAHLRKLGVTSVSLLPVHQHLDEDRLVAQGLVNYWGYNTVGFFCPDPRLASSSAQRGPDSGRAARDEFRDMVRALHEANIEVILDVVFNHTCEGNEHGRTVSWRGLDNTNWYVLDRSDPSRYVNDSGCGNTLNLAHPRVLQFVLDSLRYWHEEMHVDGFRFDLAPILARGEHGFDPDAAFLQAISRDPHLAGVKLIAEPWDLSPGGYRLGAFPANWLEWNDQFRDVVRRYWITGEASRGELARRLCGSSDVFGVKPRRPASSVNFVTAHDGFTLRDLVTYSHRHNEANGEDNRDGHADNHSDNFGVEGDTSDPQIVLSRQRAQAAMLATVLLSQGTPMLCAGSELGHTQGGNNNAYCQDNETSWLDWDRADFVLLELCVKLLELRRKHRPLAANWYPAVARGPSAGISWLTSAGTPLTGEDWHDASDRALCAIIENVSDASGGIRRFALLMNPHDRMVTFHLPQDRWRALLDTAIPGAADGPPSDTQVLVARSMRCLLSESAPS